MTFTTQTAFFAEPFLFPTSAQYSEAKGNQHVNDRIYHKECAGKKPACVFLSTGNEFVGCFFANYFPS